MAVCNYMKKLQIKVFAGVIFLSSLFLQMHNSNCTFTASEHVLVPAKANTV